MELGLEGKIIVVTGGAAGIGAALVRQLALQGARPVVVDRSAPGAEQQSGVRDGASPADWFVADLTRDGQCRDAVAGVLDRLGRIDGLVNNAGINDAVGLDAGPTAFRASLERNLVHYYTMAHLCADELARHAGAIVNIASKVALTGQGGTSGYAAAKGGVLGLTREWAADLAARGVRVNAVVPGETMTPMYRGWLGGFDDPEAKLERIVHNIPLGKRMTLADEVAAAAVFLLSDWAGHVTGQSLTVDGGYSHLDRALTSG